MDWSDFIFWWLEWPIKIGVGIVLVVMLVLLLNNLLLWLLRCTVQVNATQYSGQDREKPVVSIYTVPKDRGNWWKRRCLAADMYFGSGSNPSDISPIRMAFRFNGWFWFKESK